LLPRALRRLSGGEVSASSALSGFDFASFSSASPRLRVEKTVSTLVPALPVGQTIGFCRLLQWACGPRNFMKN
jgi:hypothetical protein